MNMGNAFGFQGPDTSDLDESPSSTDSEDESAMKGKVKTKEMKICNDRSRNTISLSSRSSSGSSSDHEPACFDNKNQTDSSVHMFSSNIKITLESIHELEKDLEFSDMVSLIFLLYDGLIGLQEMHTTILGGAQGFNGKLSKWALSNEQNWPIKLIEGLAVIQNYRVLEKLGYSKTDIIVHFLPLRDTSLYLNRTKKLLYRLCEFLTLEQSKQLIELVRTDPAGSCLFENDITLNCDPKYIEFPILFWISRGYINIDGDVNLKNVTKHLKVMDLLDKQEEIENAARQIMQKQLTNSNAVDSLGLTSINVKKRRGVVEKRSCISSTDDYPIIDPDSLGLLIIINNINFENNVEKQKKYKHCLPDAPLNNRVGSDEDVEHLKDLFIELKFIVKVEHDLKSYHIVEKIQKLVKENFKPNKHSVVFMCILSHGAQGVVYGVNSVPIPIQDIQDAICGPNAVGLADVPKVVIIQACQGTDKLFGDRIPKAQPNFLEKSSLPPSVQRISSGALKKLLNSTLDGFKGKTLISAHQSVQDISLVNRRSLHTDGADLVCDGPDSIKYKDLLICKAIIEGYVAIRSTSNGSVYIQTLCQKIREYYERDHFYDIVTKVHRELNNKKMHLPVREQGNCREHKKCAVVYMTPVVHSTFTGKLFLRPQN